jgi:hypothetical protein
VTGVQTCAIPIYFASMYERSNRFVVITGCNRRVTVYFHDKQDRCR